MNSWHYQTDILVTPDQLADFAWSAPMRDLAAKIGISDVGLKKILRGHGIATPPQGYWNKVQAGRAVQPRPRLPPRGPGETGRLWIDHRFWEFLTPVAPISADGPFASKIVPEDLEELHAQELKAIGKAATPATLNRHHPGLKNVLEREGRRHAKVAASKYHWDTPKFDNPLAKRRLRILNAIFLTLARRGHSGSADDRDEEITAGATIGNTYVHLDLAIVGKHRTVSCAGYQRPDPALPASTPLVLRIGSSSHEGFGETWQDDGTGKLETKIALIAAGIIVAGEARFRRSLREEVERQERARIAGEEARQRELVARNLKRIEDLHTSGDLLRRAEEIRMLVMRVKQAMLSGATVEDEATIEAWQRWALSEADKIDPVKSGQIVSHLREPTL